MTISLDGEESAVQEMSNDIRNNILDTPMAAAASSSSMAQSAANRNAQRSDPQNASSASQSASGSAASSAAPSSAGAASSASFTPSASQANASVMAGEAPVRDQPDHEPGRRAAQCAIGFRSQFRPEQSAGRSTVFCERPSRRLGAQFRRGQCQPFPFDRPSQCLGANQRCAGGLQPKHERGQRPAQCRFSGQQQCRAQYPANLQFPVRLGDQQREPFGGRASCGQHRFTLTRLRLASRHGIRTGHRSTGAG